MPCDSASCLSRASLRNTPNLRSGSLSPASPARNASSVSSGLALLNDAMSADSDTIFCDIDAASLRAKPIGTSMFPNVPAACSACERAMPSELAVDFDHCTSGFSDPRNTTLALLTSSPRSTAAFVAVLTNDVAAASPPAASAAPAIAFACPFQLPVVDFACAPASTTSLLLVFAALPTCSTLVALASIAFWNAAWPSARSTTMMSLLLICSALAQCERELADDHAGERPVAILL